MTAEANTAFSAYCLLPTAYWPLAAFATPAFFIAGLALISIPILIHILNRRRYKVVQWAAMEYLMRAMRKNRRRLRFEQWLLLAARCALLVLLGAALARPVGCQDSTVAALAQRTGLHVFVIDNSYSMAYESPRAEARTHLEQAKRVAKELIGRMAAGGESVAIVTAGGPAEAPVARPTYDLDAARSAVDRIEQSYGGTDILGALELARQIGDEARGAGTRHLHLISDATRSAWRDEDAQALKEIGPPLANLYRITHFNLGRPDQWNAAVVDLEPSSNLVTTRFNNDFVARPRGFGPARPAALQWKLDDRVVGGVANVELSADTPPQVQSNLGLQSGGPHVVSAAVLGQDPLDVDDARHRVVDVASELKVLIVEGDRGIDPMQGSAAFLQIALSPEAGGDGSGGASSYVAPEVISDLELSNRVLSDYRAVILANVGQVQPQQAEQIEHFVREGGALILFMGDQVEPQNYNQVLAPRGLLPGPLGRRISAPSDGNPFYFDFNPNGNLHPLLKVFYKQPDSGLETVPVRTYWQVEPRQGVDRVLSYVPSGEGGADPAITSHALGDGRVVFVSSSANYAWTDFAGKPAYVPLMHELLAGSVSPGHEWMNLPVGRPLVIPPRVKLTGVPSLIDPSQREVPMEQTTGSDGRAVYQSRPLTRPGVYTLTMGSRKIPVAVNVPPEEADVRTIDPKAIGAALGDVEVAMLDDQVPAEAVSQHAGNDWGWGLMLIVLALVAFECFLAMRFGHYWRA